MIDIRFAIVDDLRSESTDPAEVEFLFDLLARKCRVNILNEKITYAVRDIRAAKRGIDFKDRIVEEHPINGVGAIVRTSKPSSGEGEPIQDLGRKSV
ncbi:MAG TPA: hypothetical protein VKT78_04370 [Fimbriimonadaceae bacterium]|nr:hypothetical protein [Fimbriimonadaceae bacterium]